jgi:DNA-binding transcriptional MerR regulator
VPPEASGRPLTVGAVVRALAEEFPDVTISKVRFLEAEGLVTPRRTASGYRQFDEGDVERLRYVLRAQRDRFWPLKVIKDNLEAIDRGLTPGDAADGRAQPPAPVPDPDVPDAADLAARRTLRLTAAELARASGLSPAEVADLVSHGLVRRDAGGLHDDADLQVAHAAAGLAAYGVEPRHLRGFRAAADREVGLVEQVVAPQKAGRDASAAARAAETVSEIAALSVRLHATLVKAGLRSR